jgi:hypothetical protein
MLMTLVIGVLICGTSYAASTPTLVSTTQDYGTVTYKFNFDTDSNEAIGHHHKSPASIKTPWVYVPFGTPFAVFLETVDSDSTASALCPWGPDTIGLALETAPVTGIAADSAASDYRNFNADIIWDFRSVSWTAFTSQHYFPMVYVDTLNDTVGIGAASLKSGTANKATTPQVNLGMLRFSMCVDAADSVLDAVARLNCYIVFKAPEKKVVMTFPGAVAIAPKYGDPSYANVRDGEAIEAIRPIPQSRRYERGK